MKVQIPIASFFICLIESSLQNIAIELVFLSCKQRIGLEVLAIFERLTLVSYLKQLDQQDILDKYFCLKVCIGLVRRCFNT